VTLTPNGRADQATRRRSSLRLVARRQFHASLLSSLRSVRSLSVRLSSLAVVALVLHVAASPAASDLVAQGAASPGSSAVFRGRVLGTGGAPIFDADVWLIAIDKHVATDSAGAFRIGGLPAGKQLVQVRHVGFAVAHDTIQLSAEHDNIRTYALEPQSTTLDTVKTVAGQANYLSPRLRAF